MRGFKHLIAHLILISIPVAFVGCLVTQMYRYGVLVEFLKFSSIVLLIGGSVVWAVETLDQHV